MPKKRGSLKLVNPVFEDEESDEDTADDYNSRDELVSGKTKQKADFSPRNLEEMRQKKAQQAKAAKRKEGNYAAKKAKQGMSKEQQIKKRREQRKATGETDSDGVLSCAFYFLSCGVCLRPTARGRPWIALTEAADVCLYNDITT